MVVEKRENAQYLTQDDIEYALTLYRVNFGRQFKKHNGDIREDALEALQAIHDRR